MKDHLGTTTGSVRPKFRTLLATNIHMSGKISCSLCYCN